MTDAAQDLEFVYTPLFDAATADLLDDEAMRHVELAPLPGRGKRGGARLLYLHVELHGRIYFLLAYAKNEQVDLAPEQKKTLRAMVKRLEELG
jgi:hypothetical protein